MMLNAPLATIEKHFTRRVVGAVVGALAISTLFTIFGYSDYEGATISHFAKELGLALASYLPVAFVVQLLFSRWGSLLADVFCIGLLGSILSWVMKLVFVDGQNGIPAFVANAAKEH